MNPDFNNIAYSPIALALAVFCVAIIIPFGMTLRITLIWAIKATQKMFHSIKSGKIA